MKKECSFRFQGHYIYRQIFPDGIYKIMVWLSPTEEESVADVAFTGKSHKECMDKLKRWLHLRTIALTSNK